MDGLSNCGSGILESLNTRTYGNGTKTVVLSYGFGADQTVWHFIIPVLACYFKVVVYDLVFSPNVDPNLYDPNRYSNNFSAFAQDLTCILDQLHLRNTIFIGHSMSALVGCIAATQRPELFEHLILMNGSPRYLNAPGYMGGLTIEEVNEIFTNIRQNFLGWAHELVPRAIGENNIAAIAVFESSLSWMNPEIALDVAKTVFLSNNRRVLKYVRIRSTIIQTENDIFVPLSVAYYMKKRLRCAKHIILRSTGHFPQLTDYFELVRAIKGSVLHLHSM